MLKHDIFILYILRPKYHLMQPKLRDYLINLPK